MDPHPVLNAQTITDHMPSCSWPFLMWCKALWNSFFPPKFSFICPQIQFFHFNLLDFFFLLVFPFTLILPLESLCSTVCSFSPQVAQIYISQQHHVDRLCKNKYVEFIWKLFGFIFFWQATTFVVVFWQLGRTKVTYGWSHTLVRPPPGMFLLW